MSNFKLFCGKTLSFFQFFGSKADFFCLKQGRDPPGIQKWSFWAFKPPKNGLVFAFLVKKFVVRFVVRFQSISNVTFLPSKFSIYFVLLPPKIVRVRKPSKHWKVFKASKYSLKFIDDILPIFRYFFARQFSIFFLCWDPSPSGIPTSQGTNLRALTNFQALSINFSNPTFLFEKAFKRNVTLFVLKLFCQFQHFLLRNVTLSEFPSMCV